MTPAALDIIDTIELNLEIGWCGHGGISKKTNVSQVSSKMQNFEVESTESKQRYKAPETARKRLYAALVALAGSGAPCPSNRDLCRLSGLNREAQVTTVLGVLRDKAIIAVEWSGPMTGARRILILGTGIRTDWSRHGPRAGEGAAIPADGTRALGMALGPYRRFSDVTRAEARIIARHSPADRGLPRRQRTESEIGCALADLRGNPEFDWR